VRASEEAARLENARLHTLAFSDPLTGLLNRRGLYLALEQSLPAALPSSAVAIYLIDLDEFKPVNDRFGHDAGDALLVEVGRRLQEQMRGLDMVARLGGDEFVVVIHRIGDDAVAHAAGRRLLAALGGPFAVGGTTTQVGATMGYALAPIDGRDASRLLKCADAGMYVGKQSGKNRVVRGSVLSESSPVWTKAA
jgi:diguanylate cyclase